MTVTNRTLSDSNVFSDSLPTSSLEHSTYENININTNTIIYTNRLQEIRKKCTHCVCISDCSLLQQVE